MRVSHSASKSLYRGRNHTRSFLSVALWGVCLLVPPALGAADLPFRRGDVAADGAFDLTDGVFTLNWLYLGGQRPGCMDAADANDDATVDLSDPIHFFNWQFQSGRPPPAPGAECGVDPTPDGLDCARYDRCGGPNEPPRASFTAAPETGEAPIEIAFDATASRDDDGEIRRYAWDFGDGESSEGARVRHTFLGGGDFTVHMTVTDDGGASGTAETLLRLTGAPFPDLSTLRHPITNGPYSAADRERIRSLSRRFPRNNLLKKGLIQPEDPRHQREEAAERAIRAKMVGGRATREEIQGYYGRKEALIRDRIELVNTVLDEPNWKKEIKDRYGRVLGATKRQLAKVSARREKSLDVLRRRQEAKPPPSPLATIEPRSIEVDQGAPASFKGVPAAGVTIQEWLWGGPEGLDAKESAAQVDTDGLDPGLHEIFLTVTDSRGNRTHDSAALVVRAAPPPSLDLAVEGIQIVEFPEEKLAGQVEVQVVVRNRGTKAAAGATVVISIDGREIHTAGRLSLNGGHHLALSAPPTKSSAVYGHEVAASIATADPELDANPKNNRRTVVPNPPAPSGGQDTIATPRALRFDGPGIPPTGLAVPRPALVLQDLAIETAPLPISLGPIDGFADLHIHQLSNLAYDGRFVWGAHDGPSQAVALPECNGMNHALCWLPGSIMDLFGLTQWEAGAHSGLGSSYLFPFFGATGPCEDPNWMGGEGRSTKGWHSDTATKAFKHWPIWKTVTHQQVFADWLEEAHNQGLNLIVMSAVNARHLCSLMPESNGTPGTHPLDVAIPDGIANVATDRAIASAGLCNDMRNVRRQLVAARQFDEDHDWYEIAYSPGHAAQIVQEGRMAVVLSMECSELFDGPETVGDLRTQLDYFVDDLGVRSIQPIHELNNAFGGASYWNVIFDIIQSLEDHGSGEQMPVLAELLLAYGGFDRDATGDNSLAISTMGFELILESIARRLLIDVAHMSRIASTYTYNSAKASDYYPIFISHARYKDLLTTDPYDDHLARHWETIQEVKELGGMVGLRTGKNRVREYTPSGVNNICPGSVRDFAQSYTYGAVGLGIPQAFATDMNGFIEQMRPRFADPSHPKYGTRAWACGEGISFNSTEYRNSLQDLQGSRATNGTGTDFDLTGFGHIGQIGGIIDDLDNLDVDTAELEDSVQSFIEMWQRVHYLPGTRSLVDTCMNRLGIENGPAVEPEVWRPGCP